MIGQLPSRGFNLWRSVVALLAVAVLAGCAQMETKQDAYPGMYEASRPLAVLVLPAINQSTAADAGFLLDVTVAQPFSNHGYYILPVPLTVEIFQREGIIDGEQLMGIPGTVFREAFGADAVLFITIEEWETRYLVIAGNVTVSLSYVLKSAHDESILWSYKDKIVVDTSGSSGFILADIIATAVATAMTDYVPVAIQVHEAALKAMPHGRYHPKYGVDGADKAVNMEKRTAALGE